MKYKISKIISGGQTGADRAGLDIANRLSLEYGGSIPKGRLTEDGSLDPKYARMTELTSSKYPDRTKRNVLDSDATLIFTYNRMGAGSALTKRLAVKNQKPYLYINLEQTTDTEAVEIVREWLDKELPGILNIAGSRESTCPGIYQRVYKVLMEVIGK